MLRRSHVASAVAMVGISGAAIGQVDPGSGIDFVTIGAVGNAPWTGGGFNNGFGRVDYEYRIGRFEVTTAQWVEFMNAALDRPATDALPHVRSPAWNAAIDIPRNGGRRWRVPVGREMEPVGGLTWRTCAMYCNWLHNDKRLDRSAFLNGAYDASTFYYEGTSPAFHDQLVHHPDARYWIPTQSEWLKAAHYDPAKQNADGTTGGYWNYGNSSDTRFVYGPPGVLVDGQLTSANAFWSPQEFPGVNAREVLLGAYGVTSPWGLYDVAGATAEWLERYSRGANETLATSRFLEGSSIGSSMDLVADLVSTPARTEQPSVVDNPYGFRIASSIPSPASGSLVIAWAFGRFLRRRRRHDEAFHDIGRTAGRGLRPRGRAGRSDWLRDRHR